MIQGRDGGPVATLIVILLAGAGPIASLQAQVVNDDRAAAQRIRPGQVVTASTALATPSPDPLPATTGCQFIGWSAPRKDVWYRFDPPQADGFLSLDLCESTFDTSVVLYRLDTASGAIEQFACDDDDCNPMGPSYQSRIQALRLVADPRPVLVRVAGWSDQVGILRMRADWQPAASGSVRFTGGGLFHRAEVMAAGGQSASQGPGRGGAAYSFVQGQAQVGSARAGGFVGAEIRCGWGTTDEVRIEGILEAAQPANAGAMSRFRCSDGNAIGENAPLEFTLDADRYFRLSSSGSMHPTLIAGSGCLCGARLTAGTYLVDLDFGVLLQGAEASAEQTVAWRLELSPSPFRAGDLDGNGSVDGTDLGIMLATWGGTGSADLNADGIVDATDLGTMLADWGA